MIAIKKSEKARPSNSKKASYKQEYMQEKRGYQSFFHVLMVTCHSSIRIMGQGLSYFHQSESSTISEKSKRC